MSDEKKTVCGFASPGGTFAISQGHEPLERNRLNSLKTAERRQKLLPPLRGFAMKNALFPGVDTPGY